MSHIHRILVAALLLSACVPPNPDCNPTRMMRDIGQSIHGVQSCYVCEGANACTTAGNQWCCSDPMCTECSPSLVPFPTAKKKGK